MMRVRRVRDISLSQVIESDYNLTIVASGYEPRCVHLVHTLKNNGKEHTTFGDPLIMGFRNVGLPEFRQKNDRHLQEDLGAAIRIIDSELEMASIYRYLNQVSISSGDKLSILVDYSSMSRLWYGAILNWIRFTDRWDEVVVDFSYSIGRYSTDVPSMWIEDIIAVPGFEGNSLYRRQQIVGIGLGFDNVTPFGVLERMEPDLVLPFLAVPGAYTSYSVRAKRLNRKLIQEYGPEGKSWELPLRSVQLAFSTIAELLGPYRFESNISLVPLGPKPHVLASLLVSLRFEEIAVLRLAGERLSHSPVASTGDLILTRVELTRDEG
jgi:hypothetical protein